MKIPDVAEASITIADVEAIGESKKYCTLRDLRKQCDITYDQARKTCMCLQDAERISPWHGMGHQLCMSVKDFQKVCRFRKLFDEYGGSYTMALTNLDEE